MQRHAIDDTDRVRPHVRLCHKVLREGLGQGFKSIVFEAGAGAMHNARALKDGRWQVLMAFPSAVYDSLVACLREMAGIAADADPAGGTIDALVDGRPVSVAVVMRRDEDGYVELTLLFPAARVSAPT